MTALLTKDLMRRVGLIADKYNEKTPSQLSPSEQYRLQLVKASLESMLQGRLSFSEDKIVVELPAPVLLLDEWLDKETSSIVQKVRGALEALVELGAVVCSVTHKPERWQNSNTAVSTSHMTLCRGEILLFTQRESR
jgi:ABC-type polysaccharide/polyol phosphate transport system ATPase subunit